MQRGYLIGNVGTRAFSPGSSGLRIWSWILTPFLDGSWPCCTSSLRREGLASMGGGNGGSYESNQWAGPSSLQINVSSNNRDTPTIAGWLLGCLIGCLGACLAGLMAFYYLMILSHHDINSNTYRLSRYTWDSRQQMCYWPWLMCRQWSGCGFIGMWNQGWWGEGPYVLFEEQAQWVFLELIGRAMSVRVQNIAGIDQYT